MEEKKNNTTIIAIIAVVAVVAIGGAMMMMSKNKSEKAEQQQEEMVVEESPEAMAPTDEAPKMTGTEDTEMVADDDVKVIEVEMGAFYYKPNVITVKKGQKVKLVLKSADMMHDFNIDELNVKSDIVKSGNTGQVEFTADKVGTFEYYCSVGEHRAKGQIGKLIVQ